MPGSHFGWHLGKNIRSKATSILVTGGAGFIGSHLGDRLIEQKKEVIVLDDFNDYYDPRLKRKNVEPHLKNSNFKLVEGDIRDKTLLEKLFQGDNIEKVVHLAARAGVRTSIKEPFLYEEVNVKGTLNLLQLSVENNVKQFIFGSSSSVYGVGSRIPFMEDQRLGIPVSPYAASKRAAEHFCHVYSHLYRLPVVILRFFTVYGRRQRPEMAIHKFTRLISEGREIPVFGDGTSKRDYTYFSDIVEGMLLAMEKSFDYEVFNLGNSHSVELMQLISLIEKSLGKPARMKKLSDQPGDVPVTCASINKAQKLLGYRPKVSIEEGIAEFVDWFRKEFGWERK